MSREQDAGDRFRSEALRSVDVESTFHLIERARAGDHEALDRRQIIRAGHCRDPSFALAYAGLAEAYTAASEEIPGPFKPNAIPPETALALMGPAAQTALRLDPLLAEAHAAMGLLYSRKLDWQKAEESFRRAIDPGNGGASWRPTLRSVRRKLGLP